MKKFRVEILTPQVVTASVIVEAATPAAAKDVALGQAGSRDWQLTAKVKPEDCYVSGCEEVNEVAAEVVAA